MLLSDHHRYHQRRRLRRNLKAAFEWGMAIVFMVAIALATGVAVAVFGGLIALVP